MFDEQIIFVYSLHYRFEDYCSPCYIYGELETVTIENALQLEAAGRHVLRVAIGYGIHQYVIQTPLGGVDPLISDDTPSSDPSRPPLAGYVIH